VASTTSVECFAALRRYDSEPVIPYCLGGSKKLLAVVYPELKRVADGLLRRERADHTLQPTALVHEAYIRLSGVRGMRIEGRRHFYGAAAMAMRDHCSRACSLLVVP
jgi:hypothetical protein